jgi:hypothetical protein
LDTEAGIGYGITGKNQLTPIAEGLSAKGQVSSTKSWQMGNWEQYLFQQWLEAYRQKAFQIDLQEKDIAQLYSDKPPMARLFQ